MVISTGQEKGIINEGEGSPVEVGVLLHHRNNSGQSWAGTDCRVAGVLRQLSSTISISFLPGTGSIIAPRSLAVITGT